MTQGLRIRHLSFHSPLRPPATVVFGPGLNVIYGASNTGKSFVVDAIDFMLGGRGPLRDIPERIGYDRMTLGIETISGEQFTIVRSTDGGSFLLFDGLHDNQIPHDNGKELAEQHNDKREDNLSAFLLSKVGLANRRLRRNKQGDTQSLSFRNLARLMIINEEEIIQQRSPLSDGNYSADTANVAVFKLLLTGIDDSSLIAAKATGTHDQSRGAQIDLLEQLIQDYRVRVRELAGPPKELSSQLDRLDDSMHQQQGQLSQTESEYRELSTKRREFLKQLEEATNRVTEISGMVDRFGALEKHYASDLERLAGVIEAGSLFMGLKDSPCPLCGAAPDHHRAMSECDGNVDAVVAAARAEIEKIRLRKSELSTTIFALKKEESSFDRRLPILRDKIVGLSRRLENFIGPTLRGHRAAYSELAARRGEIREALSIYDTLTDLEERKLKLEGETTASSSNASELELSSYTADQFATIVQSILLQWDFPNLERTHFDLKVRDLVINGKNRISFGKGLRAITQSAFTIGLLEFCRRNDTSHPGLVVLDSPLLSYREPDTEEDDLRGTHLNESFYLFLKTAKPDRQFIVVENTDPPQSVRDSPQAIHFSGNAGIGRFGLFPLPHEQIDDAP